MFDPGTHSANGQGNVATIVHQRSNGSTPAMRPCSLSGLTQKIREQNAYGIAPDPTPPSPDNKEHLLIALCLQHPKLVSLVIRQIRPITCDHFSCAESGRIFSAMYMCTTYKQPPNAENILRELEDRLNDPLVSDHTLIRRAIGIIPHLRRAPFPQMPESEAQPLILDLTNQIRDAYDFLLPPLADLKEAATLDAMLEEAPHFDAAPEPLGVRLKSVQPLSPDYVPEPLRDWLFDITDRMSCPIEYVASAALVTLSILCGRKLGIRPKRHDHWLVIPNLWGGAVGPPGVQKTPATKEAMRPVNRLVSDFIAHYQEAKADYELRSQVAAAKAKAGKAALEKAARSGTSEESLLQQAREIAVSENEKPPLLKRRILNDCSVEAAGERLAENPNGIMIQRDELMGFFHSLDKQGSESARAFYLEGWDGLGENFVYDRIGRGTIIIEAVCIAIYGTIQPGPLSHYIRSAYSGANEGADGLLQRFQLLVFPDTPPWKHVDRIPDLAARNRYDQVFERIENLDPASLGAEYCDSCKIPFLNFDSQAQEYFNDWWCDLETRKLRGSNESPLMESHMAKYRSLMPSLALLFHIVEAVDRGAAGPVSLRATEMASTWCELLESHMRRICHYAMESDVDAAQILRDRLDSLPNPFTAREVVQKGWSGLKFTEDVTRAIIVLEERQWIKAVDVPPGTAGGRPSRRYWINPMA
jgi:putative DNA primase/helicase